MEKIFIIISMILISIMILCLAISIMLSFLGLYFIADIMATVVLIAGALGITIAGVYLTARVLAIIKNILNDMKKQIFSRDAAERAAFIAICLLGCATGIGLGYFLFHVILKMI